jgi:hypothetical protein
MAKATIIQDKATTQPIQSLRPEIKGEALRRRLWASLPFLLVIAAILSSQYWTLFLSTSDIARYQCYALYYWYGEGALRLLPLHQCAFAGPPPAVPYSFYPFEYPPLTLLVFLLPLFFSIQRYPLVFALMMALVAIGVYYLLLRYGTRRAVKLYTVFLVLGAAVTTFARYDLIPAALTLLAVLSAERKRWPQAYIFLAFGVLMKYYPIVLLPVFFLAEQIETGRIPALAAGASLSEALRAFATSVLRLRTWRWKNTLLFSALVLAVMGLFAVFDLQNAVLHPLLYLLGRPVQIESVQGTLLWLASLFGVPLELEYSYGSLNWLSPLGVWMERAFTLFLAAGLVWILKELWQQKMDLLQAALAALILLVATGKVFSPQYLLWLIPLIAYSGIPNRTLTLTWIAVCVLTSLIFPGYYSFAPNGNSLPHMPGFLPILAVRNGLMVALAFAYLLNVNKARERLAPSSLMKERRPLGQALRISR